MNKYFLFVVIIFFVSCASKKDKPLNYVSLMSFNVETLFDTQHDSGKLDYTFLPMKLKKGALKKEVASYCATLKRPDWKKECLEVDWDNPRFNEKIRRVAQIIYESTAGCPDIVVLQEIENNYVLNKLREALDCGYQAQAISDDRDARGIDIAVLSKYPIAMSFTETIPFTKMDEETRKDTRGLLHAQIELPAGLKLSVLGIHLPAPFHPVRMRKDALFFLDAVYQQHPQPTIIAGDWNIPDKENEEEKMLRGLRRNFTFSEDIIRSTSADLGSTYYAKDGTWSFMDKIALSRNSFDRVECKVINFIPGQRNREGGEPVSFPLFGKLTGGVSDHFPLLCRASY